MFRTTSPVEGSLPLAVISHFRKSHKEAAARLAPDGDFSDKSKHVGAERLDLGSLLGAYQAGQPLANQVDAMVARSEQTLSIPNMATLIDKQNKRLSRNFDRQQDTLARKRREQNQAFYEDEVRLRRDHAKATSSVAGTPPRGNTTPRVSSEPADDLRVLPPGTPRPNTVTPVLKDPYPLGEGVGIGMGVGNFGLRGETFRKTNSYRPEVAEAPSPLSPLVKVAASPAEMLLSSDDRGSSPRILAALPFLGALLGGALALKNPRASKYLAPAGGNALLRGTLGAATGGTLGWLPEVTYNAGNALFGDYDNG